MLWMEFIEKEMMWYDKANLKKVKKREKNRLIVNLFATLIDSGHTYSEKIDFLGLVVKSKTWVHRDKNQLCFLKCCTVNDIMIAVKTFMNISIFYAKHEL